MPEDEHDRPQPPEAIRRPDARAPEPEPVVSILLADSHALFRAGMRHLLRDLPRPTITFEAGTCAEAVAVLRTNTISFVLLELLLPDGPPDRLLVEQLRAAAAAPVPIIVISAVDDPERICHALEQGAAGFIPKTSAPEVMLQAIALVLAGGVYVPPAVLKLLQRSPGAAAQRKQQAPPPAAPELTERQRAVLACLAKGWSNKQIAHALGLSEGTVKIHLAGLLKALDARNRTQALVHASERRLLP